MKENLLITSFSMLLLVSSSISSDTADKSTADKVSPSNEPSTIVLAKADLDSFAEHGRSLTEQAQTPTTQIEKKYFSEAEARRLRSLFLKAEKAIKKNDDLTYFRLSSQLEEYPLHPYLQYQWLSKHLHEELQIIEYLEQHESTRYGKKLKHRWLLYLGKKKQWPLFIEHFTKSKSAKLNCYNHLAQFKIGNQAAALNNAKKLWSVGYSQPRACDPLFSELKKSKYFTQDLLWQRFDAALTNNKVSLATYIKKLMPKTEQATAQLWLNLHRRPTKHIQQLLTQSKTAQSPLMFTHAINRMARKNITAAIRIWDTNKQNFNIAEENFNKLEKRLAFKLVYKRENGAYDRLSQLEAPDTSSKEWRIRMALTDQNWPNVITSIEALSEEEKASEKWQYWLARAYLETNKTNQAQAIFSQLSKLRSFYGYMAADKVSSIYQLSDDPLKVTTKEINRLENRRAFRVSYELMKLDRVTEAKLQWWHALRQLDRDEIIIASKLAEQWQWDEVAIFTIAKVKHWDDIKLRFPLAYAEKIHHNSAKQKLNPAIIFGLVRRESAFNEKARSPAGARGLMQIMPQTGKQIARDLNERWRGSNSLYKPEKNIKYGSYYYQKLLNKFDGNYALALAAYNAGPHRVKRWLPKTGAVPADIWIETIPFKETREYVTTVLTYALIYQQRMQSEGLSMNEFTRSIQPL